MPTLSWIRQLGSSSHDFAHAIAVDPWGNVFICGYTEGAVEPGHAKGNQDARSLITPCNL